MHNRILRIIILLFIVSFSLSFCSDYKPNYPTVPEIPGTELIDPQLPSHQGSIGTGGIFEYAPPSDVTYLVLVIGDDSTGANPLGVSGQMVTNVKFGCTTDMGMSRNSVSISLVQIYDPVKFIFSGKPTATGNYSWFVVGYDSNFKLVASSPKYDVTINSW